MTQSQPAQYPQCVPQQALNFRSAGRGPLKHPEFDRRLQFAPTFFEDMESCGGRDLVELPLQTRVHEMND